MRSQPASTSGRRLAALVVCMLLLGAASAGFDAVLAHAATNRDQMQISDAHEHLAATDLRQPPNDPPERSR